MKEIRKRFKCGYSMPGQFGGDMTAYASKGTYFLKGERLRFGVHIYECYGRTNISKKPKLHRGRWAFELRIIRMLSKTEFVDRKYPPEVKGKPW